MKNDVEKMIKYEIYLEYEKIRLAKVEIRELKASLELHEDDEHLQEIIKEKIYQQGQNIEMSKFKLRNLGTRFDNIQNNSKARTRNKEYPRH